MSALRFTNSIAPPPPSGGNSALEADWTARSTQPGVVWAHDFRSDNEVNNFRFVGGFGIDRSGSQGDSSECFRSTSDFITGSGCLVLDIPAGATCDAGWWRPFSPLFGGATSNGLAADDPADGLTKRSYDATNANAYNVTTGYYGRTEYHGTGQFDGTEFYLQFRCKITNSRDDSSQPDGKLVYLDIPAGGNQEIVIQSLQSTTFRAYTNFGSRYNSFLDHPQNAGSGATQLQPFGAYHDAGTTDANLWKWPMDEWVTVLVHMIPGQDDTDTNLVNGPANTTLEIWVAKQNAYVYTKLWEKTDFVLDFDTPNGYNVCKMSGYMNNVNAIAGWQHRFTQVIFSRTFIPCPLPLV